MTKEIKFILNQEIISAEVNYGTVLLDFIRGCRHLTGTKEGCKEGDCGACTVLTGEIINGTLHYKSQNSCLFPLGNAANKHIVTIEGLNSKLLTIVQNYFVEEGASQCGFCTPGFIVSLSGYLLNNEKLNFDDAVNSIGGNICRCTGYTSIKRAINKIIGEVNLHHERNGNKIEYLIKQNVLPEYFNTIGDKLFLLAEEKEILKSNGEGKYFVAGGTDLYVQQPDELQEKDLIFLADKNLAHIKIEGNRCFVGGTATFEMINNSPLFRINFPNLNAHFNLMASLPIRNSATIGGNIINASPIGDLTIFFLALNSRIILKNGSREREIFLKDLFMDYKTLDKSQSEFLEWIIFDLPAENSFFNFEKVSKRTHLDIASVNSAIYLEVSGDVITRAYASAGGVAPVPLYLTKTSDYLTGKDIRCETVIEAISIASREISPISDIRGSAEYKSLLFTQLFKAHFLELFPEKISFGELV